MRNQLSEVRVGVIGAGVMGGHHARVAASLEGSELVGVYDADHERAAKVARDYGVEAAPSLESLCERAEAVVVASPTITHGQVGRCCLEAGRHVLVEKPIAATIEEAEELVALAESGERILMIGHVERFNPAVTTARAMIAPDEVFDCQFQRLSPVSGRDRSVDIVLDLMIHDIDLACAFVGSRVVGVKAQGHKVRGDLIDHVTALLTFESGATATLTASAVSQSRVRTGEFFTMTAQYTVDFASREVLVQRDGRSALASNHAKYTIGKQVEQVLVPAQEPLANELAHFLAAAREGTAPEPSGEAGLEALRIACRIQRCVNEGLEG